MIANRKKIRNNRHMKINKKTDQKDKKINASQEERIFLAFKNKIIAKLLQFVMITVAYKIDLPSYFNLKSDVPYIGCILTGILLSRGSNYIFDLLEKLSLS